MPNQGYRLYTDACDYGLAGILQQVQPIVIKDLKGTRLYDRLRKVYDKREQIPSLVTSVPNDVNDIPPRGEWASSFEDTIVHVERVIAYWSRILKVAERNYSPTEREALALKEVLIKFQSYLEGSRILAITEHAALTWSRTFQNVNKRLLTWGTVFSAYPGLKIIHRAGRVHSNVDPISRLRRRVPYQDGPSADPTKLLLLASEVDDPIRNMYVELGDRFKEKLLRMASKHTQAITDEEVAPTPLELEDSIEDPDPEVVPRTYATSAQHALLINYQESELKRWTSGYQDDPHFKEVLKGLKSTTDWAKPDHSQYFLRDDGLRFLREPKESSQ